MPKGDQNIRGCMRVKNVFNIFPTICTKIETAKSKCGDCKYHYGIHGDIRKTQSIKLTCDLVLTTKSKFSRKYLTCRYSFARGSLSREKTHGSLKTSANHLHPQFVYYCLPNNCLFYLLDTANWFQPHPPCSQV